MKTIKYIIPALLTITLWSNAQTADQNVTVERDYKPAIQDAGKISSVPEIMDINITKTAANYSIFDFPLPIGTNIQNLSAAELEHQRRKTPSGSYFKVGLGSYYNNMLDFALPIINKPKTKLDLNLNHFGTLGSKKHIKTDANVLFNQYFNNFDLYAGIGAKYEYFNYYGNNFKNNSSDTDFSSFTEFSTIATDTSAKYNELHLVRVNRTADTLSLNEIASNPDAETFWRFNSFVGIRSLPQAEKLRYHAQVGLQSFSARNGLSENNIRTNVGFNTVNEKNRIGIDLDLQNMIYKSDIAATVINVWDAYSVFTLNPYYYFERDRWNIRLGVKSSFSFAHGKPFNPSPDISLEWKAVPRWLSIYGGAGGDYNVNTMDKMFNENRWMYSDLRVKDTYTPINAYFGVKVKPVYNLLFDAYISYKYIDNQYFFTNKDYAYSSLSSTALADSSDALIYTNRFNVLYRSASLTKVGVRANYNIRNFLNVEVKGAYNGWKTLETDKEDEDITRWEADKAWNMPKWEADLSTNLRLTRNLNLSANAFVESARYAKFGDSAMRLRPKVDINLGASYSYLNWFSMFVKVNNIINNRYEEYAGYEVQGFNVMAGAAFSF